MAAGWQLHGERTKTIRAASMVRNSLTATVATTRRADQSTSERDAVAAIRDNTADRKRCKRNDSVIGFGATSRCKDEKRE